MSATRALWIALSLAPIGTSHAADEPAAGANRFGAMPNIVLILADDLGYGDLSCYNPRAKVPTPRIDRLAREGVRFTDAHSPSTVCTPTRYSLLTGRMPFRGRADTVFVGSGGPCLIREGQLTLPGLLRAHGYATAMTGKWHVGLSFFDASGQPITRGDLDSVKRIDFTRSIPDAPIHRGFDRFFGTACCPGTDTLYAYIVGDRIPNPPDHVLDRSNLPRHPYANDNRPGMIAPGYDIEEVDMVFLQKSREFLADHLRSRPNQPFFLYHATAAVHLPSFAARRFRGTSPAGPHGDFLNELDFIVGALLDTIETLGIADHTLVIVTSDNGPEVTPVLRMRADYGHDGARPWRGMKRDGWEGGHRVPFLVRWPGKVKPGTSSAQLTSLTDVMATIAAVTGAVLPDDAAEDSYSMLPAWLGQDTGPIRPYLLQQAFRGAGSLSIRQGKWKYLDHAGSGGNAYGKNPGLRPYDLPETAPGAPGQLYDLEADPGETRNLYFDRPRIVAELKALLDQSRKSGRSRPARPAGNP